MSRAEGRLIICDRCGATVFCKRLSDGNDPACFEKRPAGWTIPTSFKDLCPQCSAEFNELVSSFLNKVEST